MGEGMDTGRITAGANRRGSQPRKGRGYMRLLGSQSNARGGNISQRPSTRPNNQEPTRESKANRARPRNASSGAIRNDLHAWSHDRGAKI
eukprot:7005615-Pyramimonas_sp.AAC.1